MHLRPFCTRRSVFSALTAMLISPRARAAAVSEHQEFVNAAFNMKAVAVAAGDQPYGAVVVRNRQVVGLGPSRVVSAKDPNAHAERVAIRDAQIKLGDDLSGCILYS